MVKKTAVETNARKIDQAARWGKPQIVIDTTQHRADALLSQPRRLEPTKAEPVDTSRAIGRAPEPWEAELIEEARLGERSREGRLFDGVASLWS